MDSPSTSQEAMDLFLLISSQKQGTLEEEGNQKGFCLCWLLNTKYNIFLNCQSGILRLQLLYYCEQIIEKLFSLQTFTKYLYQYWKFVLS